MIDPGPGQKHVLRTHTFVQIAFVLAAVIGVLELLQRLQPLMIALGASFVLAYLLDPGVQALHRRRVPRILSVFIVLSACGSGIALLLLMITPLVSTQVDEFVAHAPERIANFSAWIEASTGVPAPMLWEEWSGELSSRLQSLDLSELLGSVSGGIESVSRVLLVVLLVPIFTLYLLLDFPRMIRTLGALVPPRSRPAVFGVAREISDVIAQWVRGELVLMTTLSALYSVGLVYVDVPLAVLVGAVMGMLAFIPYIGPGLGLALGIVLTLMDFQGWGQLFGLVGVFVVVQTLDAVLITPRILGGSVGLNPVAIIAGLMVGGALFGIGGIMVAVPLTATLVVIIRHMLRRYRESKFFLEGSDGSHRDDPGMSRVE